MATPDLNAPTPERRARSAFLSAPAIGTEQEQARAGLRMYRALSTVERLLRDGAISNRQADAGLRLRDDYEVGIAGARDGTGSGGVVGFYYAEARLRAVERFEFAVKALGPLWRYAVPVCLGLPGAGDISISELARRMNLNRQECSGCVKAGLTALADHYELPED
jgi:hypothetical protein